MKNSRIIQMKKNTVIVEPDGYVYAHDPSLRRLVRLQFSSNGNPRARTISGATLRTNMSGDDPLMRPPKKRRNRWRR